VKYRGNMRYISVDVHGDGGTISEVSRLEAGLKPTRGKARINDGEGGAQRKIAALAHQYRKVSRFRLAPALCIAHPRGSAQRSSRQKAC
jgi:hypothetical protein